VKFSFFNLFRFRVDNARLFHRVPMNLNVTAGQAACRLLCRSVLPLCCYGKVLDFMIKKH